MPSLATVQIWSVPQETGLLLVSTPQRQTPVDDSQVWFTGQPTWLQSCAGWHSFLSGKQTVPAGHTWPPVPPHLHWPSSPSHEVPPWQCTFPQRAERQVLEI